MTSQITVERRFCGPPTSGNGGYVCGRMADFVDGPAEVTLRMPPPLDTPLAIESVGGGEMVLTDDDTLIAVARPVELDIDVPEPVSLQAAEAAVVRYRGFRHHPFATCFVCGPEREAGDGLLIFPGLVNGGNSVAAPWMPDPSLAGEDGAVAPAYLWAALDCPGYFAVAEDGEPAVLGRMAASIEGTVRPGEACIVMGWPIGREGRKLYSGTVVYAADGRLIARSRATWIRIDLPSS